jgi:outer membrane receptor protein involved in Fe transport
MRRPLFGAALVLLLTCAPAFAQTTGNITGRVLDQQNAAVPGVAVTAKNPATGFTRTDTSDAEGVYRLTALPVGSYDVTAELQGFTTVAKKAIAVDVSQTLAIDFTLKLASLAETVNVTGATPLIETTSSSVGGVVDVKRIESLPLNGRQFANLAATIPGVGLGFHSDPTKSTQYSPQIAGGNGRNLNYQIDGGDNNDDTVGGLLQLYPLEAIQEFNLITSRYKAEYGRSNGGVMNIVTKGGTNKVQGSFFELFRDTQMNVETETEKISDAKNAAAGTPVTGKSPYRRNQFGGSFGGPLVKDKAHFFAAVERTQQNTFQPVSTLGLFPNRFGLDANGSGVFATPYRENLVTAKATTNLNAAQYLSVRYGYNQNTQPYGASTLSPPNAWGTSTNKFNSINLNHNWVLGGSKLNEFIFQYADFANAISANSLDPSESFPNGVFIGQSPNVPQQTQQKKWQFRDDFSWHTSGMGGLGHDFKAGVNFINEPHLFLTFNTGTGGYAYSHLTNDLNGPIQSITLNGGSAEANTPMKQYAVYIQDDWRVNDRVTLNLGFRYDLINGMAIDQAKNPNFVILDKAGKAGALAGIAGFEDFGKTPAEDKNNYQPRAGFAYDVHGNGKDLIRGGYGRYYDFGYTNANILFAAVNATGIGAGTVFQVTNSNGIRKTDGSFYKVTDPITSIAQPNEAGGALPLNSHIASPRIKQPYADQVSLGWSHQLDAATAIDIDYVHSNGKDLGWRPSLNQRDGNPSGPRHYSVLLAQFGSFSPASFTIDISNGRSRYDGVNIGIRRQMQHHVSVNAWYSLSQAKGTTGGGADELSSANIQNHLDPFSDVQFGPAGRTDARHRITASSIIELPMGIQVAPIFRFRSALPVGITQGVDLNQNGVNNDIGTEAFAFDGFDSSDLLKRNPIAKDLGACKTVNCGRGAPLSTLNLRVSRSFRLIGTARIEAIGEVFNLFNALNPSGILGRRFTGTITSPIVSPDLMRPTAYSGDFQQPEQRIGQIGFRFSF